MIKTLDLRLSLKRKSPDFPIYTNPLFSKVYCYYYYFVNIIFWDWWNVWNTFVSFPVLKSLTLIIQWLAQNPRICIYCEIGWFSFQTGSQIKGFDHETRDFLGQWSLRTFFWEVFTLQSPRNQRACRGRATIPGSSHHMILTGIISVFYGCSNRFFKYKQKPTFEIL